MTTAVVRGARELCGWSEWSRWWSVIAKSDRQTAASNNEANENEAHVTEQVTGCHHDTLLVRH